MPSHKEYIAEQDLDQLKNLLELTKKKIDDLEQGDYVSLWVVADYANQRWFKEYHDAINFLNELSQKHLNSTKQYELSVEQHLYRPAEAARLVSHK